MRHFAQYEDIKYLLTVVIYQGSNRGRGEGLFVVEKRKAHNAKDFWNFRAATGDKRTGGYKGSAGGDQVVH
jgi:hypothetical protein